MDNQTRDKHHNVNPRSIGVLERDWTTALLLSIFLGPFGIDQFYLGRAGKGIIKLFTLGLFGILWIVDILMIATKSVRNVVWRENKTHKKWAIVVVVALVFLGVIAGAGSNDKAGNTPSSSKTNSSASSAPGPELKTAKIGQPASDGKFEFTISSIKCGQPSVSDSSGYVTKTAQGPYCLLTLSVKNIGDKQQYFSESDQKLLNATKQQYSPDTVATLYNSNNSDVFLSQINPGNTVSGVLVYDIPKDQTPVTAELHDSAFSDGVSVSLQ